MNLEFRCRENAAGVDEIPTDQINSYSLAH